MISKNNDFIGLCSLQSSYTDCCYMRIAWREINCFKDKFSIIVHGPRGCGYDLGLSCSGKTPSFHCTDLKEIDIIMGGEDKLREKIYHVEKEDNPRVIFILGTCVSELIGDDIVNISKQCEKNINKPIISLQSSGLSGMIKRSDKSIILTELITSLIKNKPKTRNSINYIGNGWPGDIYIREELLRHLSELGIELKSVLSGDCDYNELINSSKSELNVFIDAETAKSIGNSMRERFQQPFILNKFPFGIRNTSLFYFRIAKYFNKEKEAKRIILQWEREATDKINLINKKIRGKKLAIISAEPKPDIACAFAEFGFDVTIFKKNKSKLSNRQFLKYNIKTRDYYEADSIITSGFDVIYPEAEIDLKCHYVNRMLKTPSYFLFYSGSLNFVKEISHDIQSNFHNKYERYLIKNG